jgi:hypothetical protein
MGAAIPIEGGTLAYEVVVVIFCRRRLKLTM